MRLEVPMVRDESRSPVRDRSRSVGCEPEPSGPVFSGEIPPGEEGYRKAVALLRRISTSAGFLATPSEKANYHRVWGRDGAIIGLAALLTRDEELIETFERSLSTLARHQGPQGQIPSNVDAVGGRVSYGGTTGRVDADLWFIVGCAEYWRATGDDGFLERMLPALDRVDFLLQAWEFNTRGLLFIPPTGDWADEYVQSGYVLYDQLLYLQALRSLAVLHRHVGTDPDDGGHERRASRLESLIRANYWLHGVDETTEDIYHEVLYRKGRESPNRRCAYWVPFFTPHGYGYRFDALANVLASLIGPADDATRAQVDDFISDLVRDAPPLLPAFHPVIEPIDEDWEDLQVTFSYTFKNNPYEYHNGGLWPMVTGFYVADLAARGRTEAAAEFLGGIHWANSLAADDEAWCFPEYVHGRDFVAGGNRRQGWSAAAAIIGEHALDGEPVFRIGRPD